MEKSVMHTSKISAVIYIYDSVENRDIISPSKVRRNTRSWGGKLSYFSRNLRSAQEIFHGVSGRSAHGE